MVARGCRGRRGGRGYRYVIDGQGPFPDPRSRWQPGGVHGPSHIVPGEASGSGDAVAFSPKPMQEAVIYELHVGTFTPAGTYDAASGRLQYLADLA